MFICNTRFRTGAGLPRSRLLESDIAVDRDHAVVAGEAWVDAGQDHGHICQFMADRR